MMAENPGFNQEMQSTGMAKQNPTYDLPPPGYGPPPPGGAYPPPAGGAYPGQGGAYPGQGAPYPGYGPPGGYGPPVMQQPGSMQQSSSNTNVVVINQQQQPQQPTVRAWSSGLCACFDDCGICALVWWCMPCAGICLANDMGEYPCLLCCVPNALTAMRTKIRAQLKIPGSICDDCCITYWCQPCAMCQMMREVKQARAQGLM